MKKMESYTNHLDDNVSKWFAIRTNFKHEKQTAKNLKEVGVLAYLPLVTKVRRYTRKVKKYEIPLITNYVFVKIKKSEYIKVLQTQGVLGFIKVGKNLISIPENEINTLKKVMGEKKEIGVFPIDKRRAMGKKVEIISGYLSGIKGEVINFSNKKMVIIELQNIGYTLSIEISSDNLKLID